MLQKDERNSRLTSKMLFAETGVANVNREIRGRI